MPYEAQAWFFQASCYQTFQSLAWRSFFTGYLIFDAQSQLVVSCLALLLAGLQYRLWVGNGSLAQVADLTQQIADQHAENEALL